MKSSALIAIILLGGGIFLRQTLHGESSSVQPPAPIDSIQRAIPDAYSVPLSHLHYLNVFDTVYVLGNAYLMISLEDQLVSLYLRDGDTIVYKVSTGSRWVPDGMETPTGLYSVQNKTPRAISRQYDNTPMLHWIGFNYNIGFHGLETNGYYNHLGKRPSSHGCVRMGRKDIKAMYKHIRRGTPVMVYKQRPARTLAFADPERFDTTRNVRLGSRTRELEQFLESRLNRLYNGKVFVSPMPAAYLDGHTQLRPGGYKLGDAALVPTQHARPLTYSGQWTYSVVDRFNYLRPDTSVVVPNDNQDNPAPERTSPAPNDTTAA